jgi:hypothetical protein
MIGYTTGASICKRFETSRPIPTKTLHQRARILKIYRPLHMQLPNMFMTLPTAITSLRKESSVRLRRRNNCAFDNPSQRRSRWPTQLPSRTSLLFVGSVSGSTGMSDESSANARGGSTRRLAKTMLRRLAHSRCSFQKAMAVGEPDS